MDPLVKLFVFIGIVTAVILFVIASTVNVAKKKDRNKRNYGVLRQKKIKPTN